VAEYVAWCGLLLLRTRLIRSLLASVEHHGVHPEQWPFVLGVREEALAFDCRSYDVGNFRTLLW